MDGQHLARIDDIVAQGLAEKRMPGCVVCIGRRGKIVLLKAYGNKQLQPSELPMTTDTVFDMASITKPVATATSVMLLVERGQLKLGQRVSSIIPEFAANEKDRITIFDLLTHQSGLLPDNARERLRERPRGSDQKDLRVEAASADRHAVYLFRREFHFARRDHSAHQRQERPRVLTGKHFSAARHARDGLSCRAKN